MKNEINGIVLLDKPRGISSNAAVNVVKKALNATKAGHLGTLDVEGEGLLPVTLGKGTKLFDYFLSKDKVYVADFKFGITTDTLDLEGKITAQDDKIISLDAVEQVIPRFIGRFPQVPPAYSAKKINGRKAYDLARAGEEVPLKPKVIEIYDLKVLSYLDTNTFRFLIHCSSGTYIRSLCRDMASALSTYGVMSRIQRTKCGIFDIKDSHSIQAIKSGEYKIIPLDSVFDLKKINFNQKDTSLLLNGVRLIKEVEDGQYKAYNDNTFLGIVEAKEKEIKFKQRLI